MNEPPLPPDDDIEPRIKRAGRWCPFCNGEMLCDRKPLETTMAIWCPNPTCPLSMGVHIIPD
jgi:hypothetical protein